MTRRLYPAVLAVLAVLATACARPVSEPVACSSAPDAGLPDALQLSDGGCVTTSAEWPARRAELLELFAKHVYGRAPGAPDQLDFTVLEEDPNALGGTATFRRTAIKSTQQGRTHTFELIRFAPKTGAPTGVFLLLNIRSASNTDPTRAIKSEFWPVETVVARGYAIAAIQASEVAPDDRDTWSTGVIHLFEGDGSGTRPNDAWKAIAAWSWGLRRAMDCLQTDPAIDAARVAVIGHSRGGKAALWASAQDERFALTIANDSGHAGAALTRRRQGETLALLNGFFPYWFAESFKRYVDDEDALPVDQHMLLSLIAPRAVAVASASNDAWADPEGEYLGLAHASPVYALWGAPPLDPAAWPRPGESLWVEPRAYHLRVGDHDLLTWDWERYLDVADRIWPR